MVRGHEVYWYHNQLIWCIQIQHSYFYACILYHFSSYSQLFVKSGCFNLPCLNLWK